LIVLDFGKIVKRAVERQGMLGWQFNTVGVSDAITMGGEGEGRGSGAAPGRG
jgi:dihydroxy-acid dehydratase